MQSSYNFGRYYQDDFGEVHVVNAKGELVDYEFVPSQTMAETLKASKLKKRNGSKGTPIYLLPVKWARFRTGVKHSVQTCLYTSTEMLLQHTLGIKLDFTDSSWFKDHPLVGSGGVEESDTLRVVQELIDPYGLFVSRVVVTPGSLPSGDLQQWMKVLGVNPLALGSLAVSNAEFAEKSGMSLSEVDNLFRFEFANRLLRPSVACGEITKQDTEFKGGSYASDGLFSGHAGYAAPRSTRGGSLQFQVSRQKHWLAEPVFPEVTAKEEKELDLWSCLLSDDPKDTIGARNSQRMQKARKNQTYHYPTQDRQLGGNVVCLGCRELRENSKDHFIDPPRRLCVICWVSLWEGYVCPHRTCGALLDTHIPMYIGVSQQGQVQKILARCAKCMREIEVSSSTDNVMAAAARALHGQQGLTKIIPFGSYTGGGECAKSNQDHNGC